MKTQIYLKKKGKVNSAENLVILTSYNRNIFLERAIKSVLNQTFKDLILIIIDDNSSKKETEKTINKFHKDKRLYHFKTETVDKERNETSTFARNINYMLEYALNNLNVKYVSYLPCDDFFDVNRLQTITYYMNNFNNSNSCWNVIQLINDQGHKLGFIPSDYRSRVNITNPITILDHSSVTHKIELLKKIKSPYWPISKKGEYIAPDGEFFAKLVSAGGPIRKASGSVLGYKTRHAESIQGRANGWK